MGGRIGVAEDCLLAASQHGTHPPTFARQHVMANEIDLWEVADEPPDTQPVGDLLVAETEGPKLPVGHRPVLGAGELRDSMIQVVSW